MVRGLDLLQLRKRKLRDLLSSFEKDSGCFTKVKLQDTSYGSINHIVQL